jgi:hypothetical protein
VKFLLDHDVPAAVKDALERHEHDVIRLTDLLPRTASDEFVALREDLPANHPNARESQRRALSKTILISAVIKPPFLGLLY